MRRVPRVNYYQFKRYLKAGKKIILDCNDAKIYIEVTGEDRVTGKLVAGPEISEITRDKEHVGTLSDPEASFDDVILNWQRQVREAQKSVGREKFKDTKILVVDPEGGDNTTPPTTETETTKEEPKSESTEMEIPKERSKDVKIGTEMMNLSFGRMVEATLTEAIYGEKTKDKIESYIKELCDKYGIVPNRTEVVVKNFEGETRNMGPQHYLFETILKMMSVRVNVALVGPAGSGKTTAVSNAADALNLKFYTKSVSAQTGTHEFFGYQDANGNYVRTLFREAFEHGGVFLVDEFDAGNPNVLAALNQATANGHCAFADTMVPKHKDFIVIMAGNTYGHGGTTDYVGRNPIDGATLDRFQFLSFPYDEKMELTLAKNKEWCKRVQSYRAIAKAKKIKAIISPRATFNGEKLLEAGIPEEVVIRTSIYKGLEQTEIDLLENNL